MSSRKIVDLRARKPGVRTVQRSTDTYERPKSALRAKRRHWRVIGLLALLPIAAIGAWMVSELSYAPAFTVSDVEVRGAVEMPSSIIRRFSLYTVANQAHSFFSRENIFLYPRDELAHAIQTSFPRIASVTVSRESLMARVVTVSVTERRPYALWCDTQCYHMDADGFVYAQAAGDATSTSYVYRGGFASSTNPIGQAYLPAHFSWLKLLLDRLSAAGFSPRGVREDGAQDAAVDLGTYTLRVSYEQDATTIVRNLTLVLSSGPLKGKETDIEYIDFRFGNRVFYQMKNGVLIGS